MLSQPQQTGQDEWRGERPRWAAPVVRHDASVAALETRVGQADRWHWVRGMEAVFGEHPIIQQAASDVLGQVGQRDGGDALPHVAGQQAAVGLCRAEDPGLVVP